MGRDGILLNVDVLSEAKGQAIGLKGDTESLMQRVQQIKSSLNWEVLAKENIDGNLQTIINNLNEQIQFMDAAAKVCDIAADEAVEGNTTVIAKIAQLIFTIKGILGNTLATTAGAVIGGIVGAAVAFIGNILSSANSSVAPSSVGTGSNSTNVASTDGVLAGTREERIATANKNLQDTYNKLAQDKMAEGKDPAYEQLCGNLTKDQLKMQGLISDKDKTWNGKDIASYFANKGTTSTGAKCTSYNSIDDLLNSNSEPITNVVCSFNKGGWVTSEQYGHGMLISRIEDGNVYFMDNRSSMSVRNSGDRHLVMQCMSVQEFKNSYYGPKMKPCGITMISK